MAVRIKSIAFDCADPYRLAQFWSRPTGFSEDPDDGNAPDDPEGNEFCIDRSDAERVPLAEQLARAFDAVAGLISNIRAELQAGFGQPGVLERAYPGPLGTATGAERLQIRLYDLLAHGWDLAQATEQPADLPDDLAEQSLAFARTQLTEQARRGRFGPAQIAAEQAPAIERLVAFLGRPVNIGR